MHVQGEWLVLNCPLIGGSTNIGCQNGGGGGGGALPPNLDIGGGGVAAPPTPPAPTPLIYVI